MRRERSLDAYVARPFGAFFAGAGFLHFFQRDDLCGLVLWGCPDAAAIRELTRALEVELPGRSPRHDAFVDTRRLTGVDPAAFEVLSSYVGPLAATFASNVARQAIVRPDGVVGALVAGFYDVTPSATPEATRVFIDPIAALDWLGREDPAALLAEIDAAQALGSSGSTLVRALRDRVAAHPREVGLASAAKALGVSSRALQSELRASGTTFRREVHATRMDAARELLLTSERKLSVIALELGFASLQRFSTVFRKETGHSPTAWRTLHRR
ncbi:MAG: AraC family transcriptional regulator [Polyangiaceae bacterium]